MQAAIDQGIAADLESIGDAISEHDGGEYRSKEEWAQEYIDSAYDLDKMLGNLACYFDYEAFARDAELGGDVTFIELSSGGVWVVNNHWSECLRRSYPVGVGANWPTLVIEPAGGHSDLPFSVVTYGNEDYRDRIADRYSVTGPCLTTAILRFSYSAPK